MVIPTSGLIASNPVAWSSSSRFVTIPFGCLLRTYDVFERPPKCVSSHIGHTSPINSVVSLLDMRLASASSDGTIRIWDLQSGQCMRTIEVAHPVSSMAYLASQKILCYTKDTLLIVDLEARSRARSHFISKTFNDLFKRDEGLVAATEYGELIAIAEGHALHLASLANNCQFVLTVYSRRKLTSLAINPDGSKLAVADETGVIWVYHNLSLTLQQSKKGKKVVRPHALNVSRLHWHASAVRALAFSHDGQVLLSAGNEAVLVSWQMSRTSFGTRSFLPRLKAPVVGLSVSPDEKYYATSHADNAVRVIDQRTSEVKHTIRGVAVRLMDITADNPTHLFSSRFDRSSMKHMCATVDQSNAARVWLSGTAPSIQLFDVHGGQQVTEVMVTPKNIVYEPQQQNDAQLHPDQLVVTLMAVHKNAHLLATVDFQDLKTADTRLYGAKKGIYTLRIWKQQDAAGALQLLTVISAPHGPEGAVTSMCFHPTMPCLATSSSSGTVRLWSTTDSELKLWRCEYEKMYKGLPCNAVAFSDDGSMKAVAFGNLITLWTVDTPALDSDSDPVHMNLEHESDAPIPLPSISFELMRVLIHPPHHEVIQKLSFIHARIPILLAATKHGVYAWNVITQGIWWSLRFSCDPSSLAVDDLSNRFALSVHIPPLVNSASGVGMKSNLTQPVQEGVHVSEMACLDETMKSKLGSQRVLKRRERKRKDVRRETTQVANEVSTRKDHVDEPPLRNKSISSDTAIAIFDAMSPIPVTVHRLPPGVQVMALAFVEQLNAKQAPHRSLVSFDSTSQVTVYEAKGMVDDTVSTVTVEMTSPSDETDESKPYSNLQKLLGADWGTGRTPKAEGASKGYAHPQANSEAVSYHDMTKTQELRSALLETFQGPAHIQGPVCARVSRLMDTLLQNRRTPSNGDGLETRKAIPAVNDNRTSSDSEERVTSDMISVLSTKSEDNNDSESRSFCRSLIRTEFPEPSKSKG
ncbi:WD repeat-containing protein 75 [Gracilariopsis chorda]|uniref:WD repeat-containing protein 75 n=1 Tax=Gracilariopsis chorda TaxID=448386 RepID=A0A2V3J1G1_9FLOR|nr:WD repeat-containing protein 75 [Gracilariopsis chorda]|eukprot:PXF47797.1 WD repeat-containing protein 75 [Gracilariopsis chorda]